MPGKNFIIPNGNFKTSRGTHKYALAGTTKSALDKKTAEFHMKVMNAGGQVLSEQRSRLPQGSTYILYTYQI